MTVVLTMGTFDVYHPGHVYLFKQCALMGELTVAVNTDEFVLQFKNTKPVMSTNERITMVESCGYVSHVMLNKGGADAKVVIEQVQPDLLVVGSDWAPPKDYHAQLQTSPEWLAEHGVALLFLERATAMSSTHVKGRIS